MNKIHFSSLKVFQFWNDNFPHLIRFKVAHAHVGGVAIGLAATACRSSLASSVRRT